MDDRTAQEASRRAFRVAELFLQEAARHRRPAPQPQALQPAPAAEPQPEPTAEEQETPDAEE